LHRGLRPNEALALYWRHVDFDKGTLEIAGTVHPKRFGGIGLPKTSAGERTIKMGRAIALALREQRLRVPHGDNDLIFPNENAQPHDLSNIRERIWKPLLADAGIEHRTIYQTRPYIRLAFDGP
jgi:integrase